MIRKHTVIIAFFIIFVVALVHHNIYDVSASEIEMTAKKHISDDFSEIHFEAEFSEKNLVCYIFSYQDMQFCSVLQKSIFSDKYRFVTSKKLSEHPMILECFPKQYLIMYDANTMAIQKSEFLPAVKMSFWCFVFLLCFFLFRHFRK